MFCFYGPHVIKILLFFSNTRSGSSLFRNNSTNSYLSNKSGHSFRSTKSGQSNVTTMTTLSSGSGSSSSNSSGHKRKRGVFRKINKFIDVVLFVYTHPICFVFLSWYFKMHQASKYSFCTLFG